MEIIVESIRPQEDGGRAFSGLKPFQNRTVQSQRLKRGATEDHHFEHRERQVSACDGTMLHVSGAKAGTRIAVRGFRHLRF